MQESPIFIKTDEMLIWLVRCTEKFTKSQRFKMARRIEDAAFSFQELIQAASKMKSGALLLEADVQLSILKRRLRMAREMQLISLGQYEHASRMAAEIGRLTGAWIRRHGGQATVQPDGSVPSASVAPAATGTTRTTGTGTGDFAAPNNSPA